MRGKAPKLSNQIADYNFSQLAKKEPHARTRLRLLGLSHLQDGRTITETAQICKVARSTVHDWVNRFNSEGLEGLKERQGRGLKPKLPENQRQAFREAVLKLQDQRPGGRIKGKDVLKLMKEMLGIECSLDTVYRSLARADLVWISARSKHPKTDQAVQDAFKKTSEKKS